MKPRSKGKIKGCLGIKQMYEYYKTEYDNPVDYDTFAKIAKACNKELLNQIVNESAIVDLPYRLGKLQVSKFERSYNHEKYKWAIDFKRTKEMGFTVYFDQKFIYKWVWKKHYAIVRNKTGYKFQPNRAAKRLVPEALRNKKDFFR